MVNDHPSPTFFGRRFFYLTEMPSASNIRKAANPRINSNNEEFEELFFKQMYIHWTFEPQVPRVSFKKPKHLLKINLPPFSWLVG